MAHNRSAERTLTCPECRTVYLAAHAGRRENGVLLVDCRICGPIVWRPLRPRLQPLIIDWAAVREARHA